MTIFVAASDYNRRDIPANITELFKKFTEMMLGRWDQKKGLAQQHQAPLKDFLLQRVALRMHVERVNAIPFEEFRSIINEELATRGLDLETIDTLFAEIVERSGLVRVEAGEVRFRHMLLQEFFAGRGAPVELIGSAISDPWWVKPIIFHFGDSPNNYTSLRAIVDAIALEPGDKLFQAAVSTGLALQACYLAKVSEREDLLSWVVKTLAESKESLLDGEVEKKNPMIGFVNYYLTGRDAVSCKEIRGVARRIKAQCETKEDEQRLESEMFWSLVGLVESGHAAEAETYLESYLPSDLRLLMGIFLGCHHITQARYDDSGSKKAAQRIVNGSQKRVMHLLQQVGEELKGILLEVQGGKIKALDKPESEVAESSAPKAVTADTEAAGEGAVVPNGPHEEPEPKEAAK